MLLFYGEGLIVHELVRPMSKKKCLAPVPSTTLFLPWLYNRSLGQLYNCPLNHPIPTLVVQLFLELLVPWACCTIVPCWSGCTIFLWPDVQLFLGPVDLNETLPPPALSSHTQVEKTSPVRC